MTVDFYPEFSGNDRLEIVGKVGPLVPGVADKRVAPFWFGAVGFCVCVARTVPSVHKLHQISPIAGVIVFVLQGIHCA